MAKLEDLQNLDLSKIKRPELAKAIQEFLKEYEIEDNKDLFIRSSEESVEKFYSLVEQISPEAIPERKLESDQEAEAKKGREKKKNQEKETEAKSEAQEQKEPTHEEREFASRARKEKSKKAMEDLDEVDGQIEACREVIREYNKKKRAGKEPAKKTRLTKLKDKLLGIASLIPPKLKEDKVVRDKTERILLRTLNDLKKAWGMSVAKKAQEAIKQKFDQLDEQAQAQA